MKPRLLAVFALVVGLAAASSACGSDSATPSTATTPVPASDVATTDTAETTPAETAPAETAPVAAAGSCPVGRWAFTNAELATFYEAVGTQNGVTFEVEGDVVFDLTDAGTFAYEFNDYALSAVIGASNTRVALFGGIGGTYTANDGHLVTTNVDPQVTADATVNGTPVDATAILQNILSEFPFNDAAFRCVGPNLEIDFAVPDETAHVVLTPAP